MHFRFRFIVPDSFNLNAAVCLLYRDVQLTSNTVILHQTLTFNFFNP
ncbi:unnamed protein product [Prunus brigantina]